MRLWTYFRHFPGSAALPWTFAVLVILAGCGKNSEPSVDGSPSDTATPDQSTAVEMPAPAELQLAYPPVADLEDTATATPQSEDSAAQPAFAPLPGAEDAGKMGPADQPAAPPLALPEVPPPTEGAPVPVAPQAPDAPAQPLEPMAPVAPVPAAPAPAEMPPQTPTRPAAEPAPEPTQPDAAPPKQFHENPLREGTDDFPKNQSSLKPATQPETVQPPVPPGSAETSQTPIIKVSSKGKRDSEFDPVAENGEIFVGWDKPQKPQLALLISGRQDGYLEPCGCAGLDRMKGGLTRRHSLFNDLRAKGWPLVGIDCGGLIKGFGRQAELKFHLSVDAMKEMGYDAIALGKSDLRLPAGELLSRVASSPALPSMFVSANVAVFGFEVQMTTDHRIVEAGGYRVGITSVLGSSWQKNDFINPEIEMADPKVKLREVLKKFEGKTDLLVLLAHATMEESKELAAAFPQFDIVVTAGGNPEPPQEMEILPGGTKLIEVGEKGMNAVVLGIFGKDKIKYQRVPLDSRFADSKTMKEYMRQYQQQLKRDGLAGLGIRRGAPSPSRGIGQIRRLKEMQGLPRHILRRLEEIGPCQGLENAQGYRRAKKLRSRVHQLPRDRLAPYRVFPLRVGLPQRRRDSRDDQRGL